MKAVRFHGPKDIRVEQIEEPVCGKGQVKVFLQAIPARHKLTTIVPAAKHLLWNLRQRPA